MVLKVTVFPAPGERTAVERVGIALHPRLVTIIHAGHARERKQQFIQQPQPTQGHVPLVRRQSIIFPLCLGKSLRRFSQHRENPRRIMSTHQVQRPIQCRLRVVLPDGLHFLGKGPRRFLPHQKRHRPIPERIVHGAVQFLTQQIFPQPVIADFVAGVLPDLAQQQRILLFRFAGPSDRRDKRIRQLIRHVQPPSGGPQTQPFSNHAVLSADKLLIARVQLLHIRQGIHAPPAFISGGIRSPKRYQSS